MQAFLTPDNLTGQPECKQLALPVDLLRYAYGSLAALTDEENWEKHGEIEPAAAAEYFEDWLYALVEDSCLAQPEILTAQMESNTSIAHNTEVANYWTQASSSKSAVISSDLLTGTFTVAVEALVTCSWFLLWSNSANGLRDARLRHNGVWLALSRERADADIVQSVGDGLSFLVSPGDVIRLHAFQDSGAALNLLGNATIKPKLTIVVFPR